jgi:hypothetical protein
MRRAWAGSEKFNKESSRDTATVPNLREYYHVHSLIVWNTCCKLEKHIDETAQRIIEELDEQDEKGIERASIDLHYLQVQMANTLRYAMLPRFLGLLVRVRSATL